MLPSRHYQHGNKWSRFIVDTGAKTKWWQISLKQKQSVHFPYAHTHTHTHIHTHTHTIQTHVRKKVLSWSSHLVRLRKTNQGSFLIEFGCKAILGCVYLSIDFNVLSECLESLPICTGKANDPTMLSTKQPLLTHTHEPGQLVTWRLTPDAPQEFGSGQTESPKGWCHLACGVSGRKEKLLSQDVVRSLSHKRNRRASISLKSSCQFVFSPISEDGRAVLKSTKRESSRNKGRNCPHLQQGRAAGGRRGRGSLGARGTGETGVPNLTPT